MNIIIKLLLLTCILVLQGCGGTTVTPTAWEDTLVHESGEQKALLKTGTDNVSRITYVNGELTIRNYALDGTVVNEEVKPLSIGAYMTLKPAHEGQLLLNTSDVNIVKFNDAWEEQWHYQQQSADAWTQYTSIDVSKEQDEIVLGTFNEQGVPMVLRITNGEAAERYIVDIPDAIKVSKLVMSGDYIYAFVQMSSLSYLGVMYVFDEQMGLVAENDSLVINTMRASPSGLIYTSSRDIIALDQQLSELWRTRSENINGPKSVLVSDKIYTLSSKRNESSDGVFIAGPVLEAHDLDGNFEWVYEPTRTSRGLELSALKLTENENGGVILSFSEDTSSIGDIFDGLNVHHKFNIKHRVLSSGGSLRKGIVEKTYRYNYGPCLGWSCPDPWAFVAEGNRFNIGVVNGTDNEIISLSSVMTGSNPSTTVLAAY